MIQRYACCWVRMQVDTIQKDADDQVIRVRAQEMEVLLEAKPEKPIVDRAWSMYREMMHDVSRFSLQCQEGVQDSA